MKLFCAFIDFQKAFDSVWRSGLWSKLLKEGINGKILRVIVNMYDKIKSCVFLNGKQSDYFPCFKGVRQGENLSPLLFSLYLNDLETFLCNQNCEYFNIKFESLDFELCHYIQLLVLLYADDTVLLSNSKTGLQKSLDCLFDYCKNWKLTVNINKTKILIFNSRKSYRPLFHYGGSIIEIVDSFSYLGITFYRTGNFTLQKKIIYSKCQKAIYSLLQLARNKSLPVDVVLSLYQSMIIPIMLYGCEIWGYENVTLLEKLQLKFLKHLFKLNKRTPSNMIYGETGVYPIEILIKVKMIKFWSTLVNANLPKYSCRLYEVLHRLFLHDNGYSKWLQTIQKLIVNAGYDCVWDSQRFLNQDLFCKNMALSIKKDFEIIWKDSLFQSSKCIFYKEFKQDFKREKYIQQLPNNYVISLFRFRCSNHNLAIETGRYFGIPRCERKCKDCLNNEIGDEFHFVMECTKYDSLRQRFIPQKFLRPKSVFNFCSLFSGKKKTLLNLSKFIHLSKFQK